MRKFQRLLFVAKRSYICYYIICMTVPLSKKKELSQVFSGILVNLNKQLFNEGELFAGH